MGAKRSSKGKKSGVSKEKELMEELSANLSRREMRDILGRSLLALDQAGIERLVAGLGEETAATVKSLLQGREKKAATRARGPSSGKIRQEWDSAWAEWNACLVEAADENGEYIYQEHHWEPPYLDKYAFAEDLEPIASRILALIPHVLERDLDPDFSFRQTLISAAEDCSSGSEYLEDSGEGLAFGPKVTRCLLEWEWEMARRDRRGAFEFLDDLCALENSDVELFLDDPTIDDFVFALDADTQREMLRGIVQNRSSGHWARELASAHGGWFALYEKLCRKWDSGLHLEACRKGVSQDWKLALPVIRHLIKRKAFADAGAMAEEAVRVMLRRQEGEEWDPKSRLLLLEDRFPYDGEKDPGITSLLELWLKVARGAGEEETASALELQHFFLRHWTDGDAVLKALGRIPSPAFDGMRDRFCEDWKTLVEQFSVESAIDEPPDAGWIHALIDAVKAGGDGRRIFPVRLRKWLEEIEKMPATLEQRFQSLAVLTLDLDYGAELQKASPVLKRMLSSRRSEGDRRLTVLRRRWLKRLQAERLLPDLIRFWKRQAVSFLPDPARCGGDYRDCAEWLAVLQDLDPAACARVLQEWTVAHKRRKNLWKAIDRSPGSSVARSAQDAARDPRRAHRQ